MTLPLNFSLSDIAKEIDIALDLLKISQCTHYQESTNKAELILVNLVLVLKGDKRL